MSKLCVVVAHVPNKPEVRAKMAKWFLKLYQLSENHNLRPHRSAVFLISEDEELRTKQLLALQQEVPQEVLMETFFVECTPEQAAKIRQMAFKARIPVLLKKYLKVPRRNLVGRLEAIKQVVQNLDDEADRQKALEYVNQALDGQMGLHELIDGLYSLLLCESSKIEPKAEASVSEPVTSESGEEKKLEDETLDYTSLPF